MSAIHVICPKTKRPVSTGIAVDAASILSTEMSGNSFVCPECGATHVWDKKNGDTLAVVRD